MEERLNSAIPVKSSIFRLHRLHAVHKMRLVATDVAHSVVCMSVCVLVMRVYCAKTAGLIEMQFGGLTPVGPRYHVLDGRKDRTNIFAAVRGDKSAVQPFATLLGTLTIIGFSISVLIIFPFFMAA